jgi:hypothetical protein
MNINRNSNPNRPYQAMLSKLVGIFLMIVAPLACEAVELGAWHRIGPFRDQGPLLNWMDNVESGFRHEFAVEKDAMDRSGEADLGKRYPAPSFPATPGAVRSWSTHPEWIDGYYQELPRGPAPSAGESQYLYRTMTVDAPTEIELDFIIRASESDRRMNGKGMGYRLATGRYKCLLNGQETLRWDAAPGDMPPARKVMLKAGVNHFLAKVTNNRHAYGFAFPSRASTRSFGTSVASRGCGGRFGRISRRICRIMSRMARPESRSRGNNLTPTA